MILIAVVFSSIALTATLFNLAITFGLLTVNKKNDPYSKYRNGSGLYGKTKTEDK